MDATRAPSLIMWTGWLVIVGGVALAIVRFFGAAPPGRDTEAAAGAVAFGAVIAAPGILALLSLKDRPALLLPAAVLLVPLSFLSFALVTLPLLIPAFIFFRSFTRAISTGGGLRVAATGFLVLALLFTALSALFISEDPREYTTATTVHGTSDVITYWEAALSFALTTVTVWIGWTFSPRGVFHSVEGRTA